MQSAFSYLLVDVGSILTHIDLVAFGTPVGLVNAASDLQASHAYRRGGGGVIALVQGQVNVAGVSYRVLPVLVVEGGSVAVKHVGGRVAGVSSRGGYQLLVAAVVLNRVARCRGGSVAVGGVTTQNASVSPVSVVIAVTVAAVAHNQANQLHAGDVAGNLLRSVATGDHAGLRYHINPVSAVGGAYHTEGNRAALAILHTHGGLESLALAAELEAHIGRRVGT